MQQNDALITPFFRNEAIHDAVASKAAGRPIYKDMAVCEIRIAGDRNFAPVVPANAMWRKVEGEEVTYAQRWPEQYRRFLENTAQIADGTPLAELPFLTEGKRQELRALKIYTAEALASLDGKPLASLGANGRGLKAQAQAYLDNATGSAAVTRMAEELESLREKVASIEAAEAAADAGADEAEALKSRYAELTGGRPRGNPSIDTLRRMVAEAEGA